MNADHENKNTFVSPTFKVEENKVPYVTNHLFTFPEHSISLAKPNLAQKQQKQDAERASIPPLNP